MYLLITLGHNSSVIATENNGNILCGYEEERLTRIKSDKNFPINSIKKIFEFYHPNILEENKIFLSHWYDNFEFYKSEIEPFKNSHRYDYKFINELKEKYNFKIVSLTDNFTHHDAHALSGITFRNLDEDCHIIVADGFGNNEEVISIYEYKNGNTILLGRNYGYENSLGLVYQYATSYCGMKENQDEYKFLAFESQIRDVLPEDKISWIIQYIKYNARVFPNTKIKTEENYINVNKLNEIKTIFYEFLDNIIYECGNNYSEKEKRIIVGFIVQNVLEYIMGNFVKKYKMKNVLCVGGIFYNVKLNNSIMKNVEKICVMPLAGDQGAALGHLKNNGIDIKIENLFFGKRKIYNPNLENENIFYFKNKRLFINEIVERIKNDEIVQVYTGNMEFGPRALCHTSTLCLPSKENTEIINALNNRVNEMPMAPVMTENGYKYFFPKEQRDKIYKSEEFMIITLDYKNETVNNEFFKYEGVMHKYPLKEKYSGRPQVIYNRNSFMYDVLKKVEYELGIYCLINTSFNYHGCPIIYSIEDMISDFRKQMKNKNEKNINKNVSVFIGDF